MPNSSSEEYPARSAPAIITVDQTSMHQAILGFGGAVTDAVGINILNLTHEASESLLRCVYIANVRFREPGLTRKVPENFATIILE